MSRLSRTQRVIFAIVALAALAVAVFGGTWVFRRKLRMAYNIGRAILAGQEAGAHGDYWNVLFVHHSTGHYLIEQGNVRELFAQAGYKFWDHDYNYLGLTRPDGTSASYSYNIPDDNTDPDGYAQIFAQPVRAWPVNAFSAIMQHEVIVFKSCFPTSDLKSQEQLDEYKHYYLSIREAIARHPDHLFIVLTPPPLVPESTTPENAVRARVWADWLASEAFTAGYPNLYVLDFFDLLAEGDPARPDHNMLRAEYRSGLEGDSHPNGRANREIGPIFVEFVIAAIESYQRGGQYESGVGLLDQREIQPCTRRGDRYHVRLHCALPPSL